MGVSTVNIAFEKTLLRHIDQTAKKEHRSRSELVREAVRAYIDQKRRWQTLFEAYDEATSGRRVSEDEVVREIRKHRKENGAKRKSPSE